MNQPRPAWAKESMVLRLAGPVTLEDLSPEWAFGGATGEGVRVAVVDSGIDAEHPLLDGCVDTASSIDFTVDDSGAVIATEGPHGDVFGHGTACAGIIHALAPLARITSVRVLGPGLTGKAAAFHAGLLWAVEQGFDIINLSLGTGKKDWALAFHEVCDRAYFGRSFVVTAANNVARVSYPSLFASVASVACNTTTDPLRFHANPEPPTEFLARGIDVEVPWLNGETTRTTGNSFAAPHITGLAALIKSKHPELRPFQIKTALWATSANVREASDIEVAGRRGTMMATNFRSTSYRGTSVRKANVTPAESVPAPSRDTVVSDGAVIATATAPAEPQRDLLAEALPAYQIEPDVIERSSAGTRRQGVARVDGSPVVVNDLSGIDAASEDAVRIRLRQLSGVSHPNVERMVELVFGPVTAVVMAADGPAGQVVSNRSGSVESLLQMLGEAAEGLAALHGAGLAHGDLRPDDLVVHAESRVVVGGTVRSCVAPAATLFSGGRSVNLETMRYLAREQLEGRPAGFATDVHALGLIACELLAGRLPYPEVDRVGDLLRQRLGVEPERLSAMVPELQARVASVVDRALRPLAGDRFETSGAFAAALRAAVTGEVSMSSDDATEVGEATEATARPEPAADGASPAGGHPATGGTSTVVESDTKRRRWFSK